MLEGMPLPDGRVDSGSELEDAVQERPGLPESADPARQRRGLGRGLSEIIGDSATVRVSALLGEQAAPDVHDLQRAGVRLATALLPGSSVRWGDPGSDDGTPATSSSPRVRFDFGDHTRWLLIHRDDPLSTVEVDRLHDIALLLLAALEPTGATSYRVERATP